MNLKHILKRDYPFVTLIVAAAAVVLSQLKPIYYYFESPVLSVSLTPELTLGDSYGLLALWTFAQIENSGNSDGIVSGVDFLIESAVSEEVRWVVPAHAFYETPVLVADGTQAPEIPFKSARVSSQDVWGKFLRAEEHPDSEFKEEILEINRLFDDEFEEIYDGENTPFFSDELVDRAVASFGDFSRKISPGVYSLSVFVLGRSKEILCEEHYTFSVRSSHVRMVTEKMDLYRNGIGILVPYSSRHQIRPSVSLTPVALDSDRLKLRHAYLDCRSAKVPGADGVDLSR